MKIVYEGSEVLRKISEPINLTIDKEFVQAALHQMQELVLSANGVGLAAPQVGISRRFVLIKDVDTNEFFEMINPCIEWVSFDKEAKEEGCLSVLGEDGKPIHKKVWRPKRIRVKWEDLDNNLHEELIKNPLQARIIQHEIDHLNGKLFIDYLDEV